MKKNNFRVLLLASLLTLAGCGDTKVSSKDDSQLPSSTEEKSTEEAKSTEEVTTSSDEEVLSSSEDESSSIDETDSGETIAPFQILLNKYVYVVGDSISKDNFVYFRKYNDALGDYGTISTFTVGQLPETCPNGPVEIQLSAGRTKTTVTVYYYQDVATAAANFEVDLGDELPMVLDMSTKRPSDVTNGFYIRDYLKKDGGISAKYDFVLDENVGLLSRINRTEADFTEKTLSDPVWNTNRVELWVNGVAATLNPEMKTVPHKVVNGEVVTAASIMPARESSVAITNWNSHYAYDVIGDAEGHICYIGRASYCDGEGGYGLVDITATDTYWSYYKDYTQNPAFLFAESFNAEDDVHKFDYEKVIPEGGFWAIAMNNSATSQSGKVDSLWASLIGVDGANIASYSNATNIVLNYAAKIQTREIEGLDDNDNPITITEEYVDDADIAIENSLNSVLVRGNGGYVDVFNKANNFERFAYFYSKAYKANDEAALAGAEDVLKALIYETLPEIANEENLAEYYSIQTAKLLDEWIESIK